MLQMLQQLAEALNCYAGSVLKAKILLDMARIVSSNSQVVPAPVQLRGPVRTKALEPFRKPPALPPLQGASFLPPFHLPV